MLISIDSMEVTLENKKYNTCMHIKTQKKNWSMECQQAEDLSEEEFRERLLRYENNVGSIKDHECVKGFSRALFKRREKSIPHRKALQMLKLCKDERIFASYSYIVY